MLDPCNGTSGAGRQHQCLLDASLGPSADADDLERALNPTGLFADGPGVPPPTGF